MLPGQAARFESLEELLGGFSGGRCGRGGGERPLDPDEGPVYRKFSLIKIVLVFPVTRHRHHGRRPAAGPSGTTFPICVKGNGQLHMLIGTNPHLRAVRAADDMGR